PSVQVLGNVRLGNLEPKLQHFTMDARGAPKRVFPVHSSDEIAKLALDPGSSGPAAGFPGPIGPEPRPMPPQDRGRLNDGGPDRAGSATAGSSTPAARDHCPAAEDVAVVPAKRC